MSKKVVAALNEQINLEMESAYIYLALSLEMADKKLNGYAQWLRDHYEEEMTHAFKMIEYLQDRDAKVELATIKIEKSEVKSGLEAAKKVLAHEQIVTKKINKLYGLAMEEEDFATREFLGWFVTEQVEEEKVAREIIDLFEMADDSKSAMLYVDAKIAALIGAEDTAE